MPRSVIEDRLRTEVLKAMPLPDLALDAVVAGIPLLTGQNTTRGGGVHRPRLGTGEPEPVG